MDNFLMQPWLFVKYKVCLSGPLGRAPPLKVQMTLSAQFNTGEGEGEAAWNENSSHLCNYVSNFTVLWNVWGWPAKPNDISRKAINNTSKYLTKQPHTIIKHVQQPDGHRNTEQDSNRLSKTKNSEEKLIHSYWAFKGTKEPDVNVNITLHLQDSLHLQF